MNRILRVFKKLCPHIDMQVRLTIKCGIVKLTTKKEPFWKRNTITYKDSFEGNEAFSSIRPTVNKPDATTSNPNGIRIIPSLLGKISSTYASRRLSGFSEFESTVNGEESISLSSHIAPFPRARN